MVFLGWTPYNTRDLYLVNADGSGLQNLTVNPADIRSPKWSPDGAQIAFVSTWDGNREIYTINVNGSGLTRLTNDPDYDTGPSWAPDGTHIAFNSKRSGNWQVYVMNSDGSGVIPLTDLTAGCQYTIWSPDGNKIACTTYGPAYNDKEIYTMNPDGSGLSQLTENAYFDRMLAWSPSGEHILFLSNRDQGGLQYREDLYVMSSNGTEVIRLTTGGYVQYTSGAWSPDGSRVAYPDGSIDHYGAFIINADGTGDTPLYCQSEVLGTFDLVWSPAGGQIAYGTFDGIYTVNIDGSNCFQIVDMMASDTIWEP